MSDLTENDLKVAHELGEIRATLAAIEKNTACLPPLVSKVDRHETYFAAVWWLGGLGITGILGLAWDWVARHLWGGK